MGHLTTQQLLDLDGVRVREDRYRFDLLDLGGDVIGELAPRMDEPPVVTCSSEARGGRTLTSLQLPPSDQTHVDTVSMGVQPVMVLQNGDEWPLGVFRWADQNGQRSTAGRGRDNALVDRTTILDRQISRAVGWRSGLKIMPIIRALAGEVLPPAQIAYVDSPEVLYAPVAHPPGANRLTVINDLLHKCAYLPAHFDRHGVLQLRPTPDPNTAQPDVTYQPGGRVVAGSILDGTTLLDAPNEFVIYEASGQGPGIVGYYRLPASAPHSIERRGFPVPLVESAQGMSTYAQANLMAVALYLTKGRGFELLSFVGIADPRHDAWAVVDFYGERYTELGWRLVCRSGGSGGLMSHNLRKVYT